MKEKYNLSENESKKVAAHKSQNLEQIATS